MNWTDLENDVYAEAKSVFTNLQQAHPDKPFYAFALYTDSDGITVCPAANSPDGLQRSLAQAEIEPDDEDARYYRWATAEWAYEYWEAQSFNEICRRLREDESGEDTDEVVARLVAVMTQALARLRAEGVFRDGPDGAPILFVSVSDDDRAEDIENESARVLNAPDAAARFLARYGDAA